MLKNRIETLIWRAAQHRVAPDRAIENLLEVVLVDERVVSSFICRISRAAGELASVGGQPYHQKLVTVSRE